MLSPPRPKMTFGQRHVAINIYDICKGHLGSRGGGGGKHLKINLKTPVFDVSEDTYKIRSITKVLQISLSIS